MSKDLAIATLDAFAIILKASAPDCWTADDGCFAVEWRFPDRRFLLTFEKDSTQSGWSVVSKAPSFLLDYEDGDAAERVFQ